MIDAEFLQSIEKAFPYQTRPSEGELPFHDDGCYHCEMTVRELVKYPSPELPAPAIRYLCDELGTLSAKAIVWVLPSYVRHVLTAEDERDPRPTEFLIYNLSPAPQYAAETREQLSRLTIEQLRALLAIIERWQGDPRWNDYWKTDLMGASTFLRTLMEARAVEQ